MGASQAGQSFNYARLHEQTDSSANHTRRAHAADLLVDLFNMHVCDECGYTLPIFVRARMSCFNGRHDGTESAIDCGGSCPKCGLAQKCTKDSDCQSNYCKRPVTNTNTPAPTAPSICAALPTCSDGLWNGLESDVDCGGICKRVAYKIIVRARGKRDTAVIWRSISDTAFCYCCRSKMRTGEAVQRFQGLFNP